MVGRSLRCFVDFIQGGISCRESVKIKMSVTSVPKTLIVNDGVGVFAIQHECKPNWYHHNGLCVYECPTTTYGISDETKAVCAPCHYSCLTCSGPLDTECVTCHEDAELSNFNDSQCILRDLAWTMQSTIWFYRMSILFAINLAVLMVAAIYMAVNWYSRSRNSLIYSYSKVAYSSNGDAQKDVNRLQGNGYISDSE